jgi:hypothetical protein
MINFRDAFKKGIEAAQIAENNTKEIYSVFNELNNQLKQETNNSLKITIKEYYVTTGLQGLNDFLNFRQRETYLAIVAFNPLLNGGEEKECK